MSRSLQKARAGAASRSWWDNGLLWHARWGGSDWGQAFGNRLTPMIKGLTAMTPPRSTSFEQLLGVSTKAAHKASLTLGRVETIPVAEIHAEIVTQVEAISRWSAARSSADGD